MLLYGFVPAAEAYSAGRFVRDAADAIATAQERGAPADHRRWHRPLFQSAARRPVADTADRRCHPRALACRSRTARRGRSSSTNFRCATRRWRHASRRRTRKGSCARSKCSNKPARSLAEWQKVQGTARASRKPRQSGFSWSPRSRDASRPRRCAFRPDGGDGRAGRSAARSLGSGSIPTLPAMRAIGVRPLLAVIRGEQGLEAAVEAAKLETRQYIKRQETWLKRHMITWNAFQDEIYGK